MRLSYTKSGKHTGALARLSGTGTVRRVRVSWSCHSSTSVARGVSMDYRELLLEYADALKTDLTWASKSHITALTMLAAENKAAAASICATIERHILSASLKPAFVGPLLVTGKRRESRTSVLYRLPLLPRFRRCTWLTALSKT